MLKIQIDEIMQEEKLITETDINTAVEDAK